MVFLIIIALILLNGIFSMSEMALVSSRRFKLELSKKKGSTKAKTALELSEHPNVFLSTIQIGITVIGVFLGMYTNENLSGDLAGYLAQFQWIAPYSETLASVLILIVVTYLSIVLGELLPKRIGMTFPETITIALAKPMKMFSQLASPLVWLLSASNDMLLKPFDISNKTESAASEEEIKSIIKDSAEEGEIQDIEQDIVERVFELGDRKAKTLYTHRGEIKFLNIQDSWETILKKISEEKHSAYPVCEENNIDKVVGMISLKDLFSGYINEDFNIKNYIKTPLFINESTYAYKIMELFREKKVHHGIVVDEYGSTEGIITMDDVVDALIGDISEESQDEYEIVQRDEHSWLVDGQYSIIEFLKQFPIDIELNDEYTTVAGMLMQCEHTMPQVGSRFRLGNYELEVVDKDGQRIDKIMVTEIEKAA
ncbi:MAG: hemolysin family protein [Prevotellaceae bacterium]|jgi:putative hemolysin|nr:hemolysin family protein [Prevotellaceae bacterium]